MVISGRTSHVTADLTLPPAKGPILGSVSVTGLDLRALGRNAKFFDGVKDLPVAVSASSGIPQSIPAAKLAQAAFDIAAKGEVPFAAMKGKALHLNSLRLVGRYDGTAGT